jgi:hypothetical protein
MRHVWISALVLVLGSVVLGATVFRTQVAAAADKVQSVFVTNDAAHPVPVTSLDDPGRQAFAFFQNDSFGSPEDSHVEQFTVPTGERLVIQSVSINAAVDIGTGQKIVSTAVQAHVNGHLEDYIMAPTFTGTSTSARDLYTVSQPTTIYADGGTDVLVFAVRNTFSGGAIMNGSVQGYLIDCTAASCN